RVPRERRRGMIVACNIGPHPADLKTAANRGEALSTAGGQFLNLAHELHAHCDFFVVNLSSPNTPGLRSLLQTPELTDSVLRNLRSHVRDLDSQSPRPRRTPLLVKLPPEDENRDPWSELSLSAVINPMLAADVCDGFVAVNTSTRLALKLLPGIANPELPGGGSGAPPPAEAP